MVRAALAGIGVAFAAAPLGCFVVWRRMAYFGDATAHAAILGVAMSLAFSMSIFVGTMAVALLKFPWQWHTTMMTAFSRVKLTVSIMSMILRRILGRILGRIM